MCKEGHYIFNAKIGAGGVIWGLVAKPKTMPGCDQNWGGGGVGSIGLNYFLLINNMLVICKGITLQLLFFLTATDTYVTYWSVNQLSCIASASPWAILNCLYLEHSVEYWGFPQSGLHDQSMYKHGILIMATQAAATMNKYPISVIALIIYTR